MAKFNILSLDGGGLRGIIPLRILREIEIRTGKRVHELFDMISGTSTGGLLAACLTLRKSPHSNEPLYSIEQIAKMYSDHGNTIFPGRTIVGNIFKSINNLWNPEFSDKGIDKVLKLFISEQRIKDSLLPILVSTYDLETNQPVFFKTAEAFVDESANARVYDICRATSAAPTFLPSYLFEYKGKLLNGIDGGVYVNNPTMAAYAEIAKWGYGGFYKKGDGSNVDLKDVSILSLGTGSYTGKITQKQAVGWGQLQWVTRITDIMMKGVNKTTHYESNQMVYDNQYLRAEIDIWNPKDADMTDSKERTRNNLLKLVEEQIIQNTPVMDNIIQFIEAHHLEKDYA